MRNTFRNASDTQASRSGISVIIPAYNATEQLIEAVDSVYKQGLALNEFEVLIVNDQHSPNNPKAKDTHEDIFRQLSMKCAELSNLRIINSCEAGTNCGQSAARNAGMRAASFPIIAFLDADDLYLTDPAILSQHGSYLSRARKSLEENSDIAFVSCNIQLFGEGGEAPHQSHGYNSQRDLMIHRLLALDIFIPTIFRKEDALHSSVGGFDTSMVTVEDAHFYTHLMHGRFSRGLGTKIDYCDEPYYRYRQHPEDVETVNRRVGRWQVELKPLVLKTFEQCLPLYQEYFGQKTAEEIYKIYEHMADQPRPTPSSSPTGSGAALNI